MHAAIRQSLSSFLFKGTNWEEGQQQRGVFQLPDGITTMRGGAKYTQREDGFSSPVCFVVPASSNLARIAPARRNELHCGLCRYLFPRRDNSCEDPEQTRFNISPG